MIYNHADALFRDNLYIEIHEYKQTIKNIINAIGEEMKLRDSGKTKQADEVKDIISLSIDRIDNQAMSIVDKLISLTKPKM